MSRRSFTWVRLASDRYWPHISTTMWGERVILWDATIPGKAETSKTGPHVWPKTKTGWEQASNTARQLNAHELSDPASTVTPPPTEGATA